MCKGRWRGEAATEGLYSLPSVTGTGNPPVCPLGRQPPLHKGAFGAADSRLCSGRVSLQTEPSPGNSQIARILRKKYAVILSASEGSRMAAQKTAVILSVSEGSRIVTHGVLFPGFFVAALLRMTGGRERAVGDAGPYNYVGSPAVSMKGLASSTARLLCRKLAVILSVSEGSRMTAQKTAVILSASEGSRMATHGLLFTGFFVAVLLRMTEGRERAVGDAGPYNYAGSPAVNM